MNREPQKTSEKAKGGYGWGIGISIFAAIVFIILGFVLGGVGYQALRHGTDRLNDLGNFGSYLQGTTASFWSLAGVFLIVATFLAQQRQLKDQDRQFEIQNAGISRQNFESSFFQLLNLQNEITSQLRFPSGGNIVLRNGPLVGKECFKFWHETLQHEIAYDPMIMRGGTEEEEKEFMRQCYLRFYGPHQGDLGHYFRTLYHLFKFVKSADIEDKRRYTSLAGAQLGFPDVPGGRKRRRRFALPAHPKGFASSGAGRRVAGPR